MRSRYLNQAKKRIGLHPGSLNGSDSKEKAEKFHVFEYNAETINEFDTDDFSQIKASMNDNSKVTWVNLDSVSNAQSINKLHDIFKVHPLVIEDIVHVGQRPKCDYMEDYLFIVVKMLFYDKDKEEVYSRQLSVLLFENLLITLQEQPGDIFKYVHERLRQSKGNIRKFKSDYLAYALIDEVIDNYFSILENIGDVMEEIEEAMMSNNDKDYVPLIHRVKRNTIYLRKSVWPLREMLNTLCRDDVDLIREQTVIYLKDLYDHTIQVIDTVESFRDINSGLLDTYLTRIGNDMNQVMKGLTILASIFVPLTFIAGVYGMNFNYMPELKWHYGYFGVWALMITIAVSMLRFFKKKRWF